jgi:hypothetical protein
MSALIELVVREDGTYTLGTDLPLLEAVETIRGVIDGLAADRGES